jgi:hypothetical protein
VDDETNLRTSIQPTAARWVRQGTWLTDSARSNGFRSVIPAHVAGTAATRRHNIGPFRFAVSRHFSEIPALAVDFPHPRHA